MSSMRNGTSNRMGMMMRRAAALVAACGFGGVSLADLPAAVDRVPSDAMVIITVDNLEQFEKSSRAMMESLGVSKDDASNPFEMFDKLAMVQGLNRAGSVAAFMMKPEKKAEEAPKAEARAEGEEAADEMGHDADDAPTRKRGDEPDMLTLLPVSDYAALVTSLGGTPGDGASEVTIENRTEYLRNLGGGYAILGGKKKMVEEFKPVEGMKTLHAAAMGKVGASIADQNQVLVIANIPQMQEVIREGTQKMGEQAGQVVGMAGGGDIGNRVEMAKSIAENFARDAQVGILGIHLAEKGFWIDLGAQFKEGSEVGKLFQNKGGAGAMLARLPDQPYLFAFVMDTMGAGVKHMLREASQNQTISKGDGKDDAEVKVSGSFDILNMSKFGDKIDGLGVLMGASPGGMMGGLFANTMAVVQTSDPAGYVAATKQSLLDANSNEADGTTIKAQYKDAAETIGTTKVDSWKMVMQQDPNAPGAQQAQMAMGMLFGPSLGGYVGAAGNSVVGTMSPNRLLMKEALAVAGNEQGSKSIAASAEIQEMQKLLPANRVLEGYVGVKPIMEMAQNALSMFMGPVEWQAPEKLSPVAIGATMADSGMHARIYVPSDVVRAVADFGKAMQKMRGPEGEEMGEDGMGEEEGEAPKF